MASRTQFVAGIALVVGSVAVGAIQRSSSEPVESLSTPDLAMIIAARGMSAGLIVSVKTGSQGPPNSSPLSFNVPSGFDRWVRGARRPVAELLESPMGRAPSVSRILTDFAAAEGGRWAVRGSQSNLHTMADASARLCEARLRRRISQNIESKALAAGENDSKYPDLLHTFSSSPMRRRSVRHEAGVAPPTPCCA
jgi:hypothetical protein